MSRITNSCYFRECSATGRLFAHQIENLSDVAEVGVGDITRARFYPRDGPTGAGKKRRRRFALAGLSLGGIVAFEVLRRAPERVERLALLDTNPNPPTMQQQVQSWEEVRGDDQERPLRGDGSQRLPCCQLTFYQEDPYRLEKAAFRMARNVGEEAFLCQLSIQRGRPDSTARPARHSVSYTGSLWSARRALPGDDARRNGLCHPRFAKLVVIKDSGHLSSMEQPRAVTAILRYWLQETG